MLKNTMIKAFAVFTAVILSASALPVSADAVNSHDLKVFSQE
ncbi:MAG: hypothetical protein ACI4XH_05140 [Acutalibacteraceae bacterium]